MKTTTLSSCDEIMLRELLYETVANLGEHEDLLGKPKQSVADGEGVQLPPPPPTSSKARVVSPIDAVCCIKLRCGWS